MNTKNELALEGIKVSVFVPNRTKETVLHLHIFFPVNQNVLGVT